MSRPKYSKCFSLTLLLAFTLGLPLTTLAAAQVDFAVGDVEAVTPAGASRNLAKGARVLSGEMVRTKDGRAQLRFDDGAIISLQPESEFRIDNYHFSGQADGKERGFFSLLKGGLRTLTGLVGRANKDNYKVTTAVATVGIRGTEYTLTYLGADSIAVATGEGSIEVCNGGGCVTLVSGDSAIIEGPNGTARRVEFRPQLRPTQPGEQLLPQFSSSEYRNPNGSLLLNGNQLTSGAGYSIVWAYDTSSGSVQGSSAVFGGYSQLLRATSSTGVFYGQTLGESGAADGVVGWGRWVTASDHLNSSLNNFHYAIGRETAVSQLSALNGLTATYQMIGYTTPTSTNGSLGGAPSGTLTAVFGPADINLTLAMNVPINSNSYALSGVATTSSPSFSLNLETGGQIYSGNVQGMLYGPNASHAGVTYKFMTSGYDTVTGAAAFKR